MKQRPPRELQIPFDRVTYRDGQLLAARDLQDDAQTSKRLRQMHTKFLHQTWGIGTGFSVSAAVGSDSVHVGPGYAIDTSGREILLAQDVAIAVPVTPAADDLMLVVVYQPDTAYRKLPDIGVLCAGSDLDPRGERPLFVWRTPANFENASDIPLAKVRAQKGGLVQTPDISVRRYAARMIRPHVATGTMEFAPSESVLTGVKVDTSDSGFAATPEYFVRLDAVGGGVLEFVAQFIANSAYVSMASSKDFTYVIPGLASLINPFAPSPIRLVITWVGVEPVTGCAPTANPFRIFPAAGFTATFK